MKKNKLILIGWDAADWKVIWPLIAKGQMPSLEKLIKGGVHGNMSTMNPPYSPMLWTSVATGKTPDKHGVLGFIEVAQNNTGVRPVTANSRKARAIWNIFHNQGLKTNLVGWWPSFPAEPIDGVIISDKFQKVSMDPKKQKPIPQGAIHPESLINEFKDLRMFPFEVTSEHILPFIPKAFEIDQNTSSGLTPAAKILSENVSIHNAATRLLRTTEWDFMGIYYDLIDHFCHSYMKFYPPKLPIINQEQYEIYKEAVVGAYRFQDMMLGRVMELVDDSTTIIVMSDHGYESGNKRLVKLPKVQAAAAMDHRQFGMFVAKGPNIKSNEKIFGMGLIDIAPTILHHFNLPVGEDMDGRVALDIFKEIRKVNYISSWENVKGDFGEHPENDNSEILSDYETMQQLVELGYVEKIEDSKDKAIKKTTCDLRHNLARVYMGKKNYQEARSILNDLLQEQDHVDIAPYYMDLLTISIKEEKFTEGQKFLDQIKRMDTEVSFALYFSEASILMGLGKYKKALKVLEQAQEKNRMYNPELWHKIGVIHHSLGNFDKAQDAFEKAIEIEPDKAKYHTSLADNLIMLGEYEEAAESALTSIELVKYQPKAHYILGKALDKLGDKKHAEKAFEMASKLTPKKHHRAENAVINLNSETYAAKKDKITFKHYENQIVIVSGLPRTGTSLMMQMLQAGGLDALTDSKRKADDSNPKGYYELEEVMTLHKDNSWLGSAQNKAIKVVGPLLKFIDHQFRYKVIFMNRDLMEVVKSQQKMIGKNTEDLPLQLLDKYRSHLNEIDVWKEKEPSVELLYVDYKRVINNPESELKKVEDFIGLDLDIHAMKKCIDKDLYRNKI